jgi:predicted ATPase
MAASEAAPVFLHAPQPTTAASGGEIGSRCAVAISKGSTSQTDTLSSPELDRSQHRRESEIAEWRQHLLAQLHHRPREEDELLQTYRQLSSRECEDSPPNGIVLLSGPSGSGKTRLAKTLRKHVLESGGYFLSGKFDRLNLVSPAPYTALCSAFNEYTKLVLSRGPDVVEKVRSKIRGALGQDASVLTGMIPELAPLCGERCSGAGGGGGDAASVASAATTATATARAHSPNSSHKAKDAMERFVFVFKAFLRAVASPDHPIVLSLDDIHYAVRHKVSTVSFNLNRYASQTHPFIHCADCPPFMQDLCSMGVLTSIVTDRNKCCGLIVVFTVDDRTENHPSYLGSKLREIEGAGTSIKHIELRGLTQPQVSSLLEGSMGVPSDDGDDLARIVVEHTKGNPSDVVEFLCWLRDSDLLDFTPDTGQWNWDADEIEVTISARQVGDFLMATLDQLPGSGKDVLKVAACLGPKVNPTLLGYVMSVENVEECLKVACAKGALVYDATRGAYMFEHDGIESAAYDMIPEADRELFHLEIGRRMWRRLDEGNLDRFLFTLLTQLNIGRRLITRDKERIAVATLCLHGGIKAAGSSTFRIALMYLDFGLSLLEETSWRQHYDLTLSLHNAAAEMALCASNFERAEELTDQVLRRAKVLSDKTQAYATRVYGLSAINKPKEAIMMGFEALEALGEPIRRRFSQKAAWKEFVAVSKLLRGKSDEQLLRMPIMTDKCKLACLQILSSNHLSALLSHPEYLPFLALKMVRITLKCGASVFTSLTFGSFGMLLLSIRYDIAAAYRYGTLALKFLERFEAKEYLPRVHAAFYGGICVWRRPVAEVVEPLLEGYKVGMQTGDLEGAFLCANLYCIHALDAGSPIPTVLRQWEFFRESMAATRYHTFMKTSATNLQIMYHLSGRSDDPLAMKGELVDFRVEMDKAKETDDIVYAFVLSVCRMYLCLLFHDLDGAEEYVAALKHIRKAPPGFRKVTSGYYGALVVLALARDGRNVRKNLRRARKIIFIVDRLATLSPANCLDKVFLLEAEYASVVGQNDLAHKKYTCAVALAKESKFLQSSALGYELWARHLHRAGDLAQSRAHFQESLHWYREFGALRKVERLQQDVKHLFGGRSDSIRT